MVVDKITRILLWGTIVFVSCVIMVGLAGIIEQNKSIANEQTCIAYDTINEQSRLLTQYEMAAMESGVNLKAIVVVSCYEGN